MADPFDQNSWLSVSSLDDMIFSISGNLIQATEGSIKFPQQEGPSDSLIVDMQVDDGIEISLINLSSGVMVYNYESSVNTSLQLRGEHFQDTAVLTQFDGMGVSANQQYNAERQRTEEINDRLQVLNNRRELIQQALNDVRGAGNVEVDGTRRINLLRELRNIDGLLREVRQEQAQQEDLTNVARLQAEYITQANPTGLDPQTLSLAEDVLGESLEAAEREDQQEQIQQMFPSGAQREGAGRGDSYEYDISMFLSLIHN